MAEQTTSSKESGSNKSDKTEIIHPLPIALDKQHQDDLKHYLPSTKVKPLLVGTQEYITLVNESTSPNSKGVAILIPDWHQGAVNPKGINFLRNALPEQGWTTFTVQTDNKPDNYPSTSLKSSVQQEENLNSINEYKSKFTAMLNALSNKAKEHPGIVMIIAQGNHGAFLIEILDADEDIQPPNVIVLLSSYVLTSPTLIDERNTQFAKTLAYSEPPVLDLYLKQDNSIVQNKAPQRLNLAKMEMKVYYRQRQLNNTVMGYYPEKELLTQINSWLKSIGW